ncbi:NADH-quinone oxidoreductase subunit F [Chloroflexota bacterium]
MPQERVVLKNCGVIDPRDINSATAAGAFSALSRAKAELSPEQVIDIIKASGLRGRGGAGFPCGIKWEGARNFPADTKYVICNADEGEVGTFKDRYILEGDPYSMVEGLAIAGYAVGAKEGFIYLRAEYHYLLDLLENAIAQAEAKGFLAGFKITVREGAGAYVCGEESALMESIEGKRGESRYKPPFPTQTGLWAQPTTINNVETLMNVPRIVGNGAEWFGAMGTDASKGTKVFSLAGDVANPGVYEMVLGSSLKELVGNLGGAENPALIQIGGATGRIIPYDQADTLLAFESLLGAGAVTVFNRMRDVLDIVYRTVEFLTSESCGKCTPCRQGTEVMLEIMERFIEGQGKAADIPVLESLARTMADASLCGLGQAAPTAVLDTLTHFRGAYDQGLSDNKGGETK